MRKIFFLLPLLFLTCTAAHAQWPQDFHATYRAEGIDETVVQALGEGHSPDRITEAGVLLEDLRQEELVKALYCALVAEEDIKRAAEAHSITEEIVSRGHELALAQCACDMEKQWNTAGRARQGIDETVAGLLSEGYSPEQIIKGLLSERMQREEIIKALYCALVPPAYIRDAAQANSLTEETVIRGYELALAQCACAMEEKRNAAPVQFPGPVSPPAANRSSNASPSTF